MLKQVLLGAIPHLSVNQMNPQLHDGMVKHIRLQMAPCQAPALHRLLTYPELNLGTAKPDFHSHGEMV